MISVLEMEEPDCERGSESADSGGGIQGLGRFCESHPNLTLVRLVSWDSSSPL